MYFIDSIFFSRITYNRLFILDRKYRPMKCSSNYFFRISEQINPFVRTQINKSFIIICFIITRADDLQAVILCILFQFLHHRRCQFTIINQYIFVWFRLNIIFLNISIKVIEECRIKHLFCVSSRNSFNKLYSFCITS